MRTTELSLESFCVVRSAVRHAEIVDDVLTRKSSPQLESLSSC